MTEPPAPAPTYQPDPPPAKTRRSVSLLVAGLIALGVGLVGCLAGIGVGGATTAAKTSVSYAPSPYPVVSTVERTVTVTVAPSPTPPPGGGGSIGDGQWIVGEDFPPGTYQATSSTQDCYWDITKSGSNHQTFIDQELGLGHWKITLKQGEDFETKDCGDWSKIG